MEESAISSNGNIAAVVAEVQSTRLGDHIVDNNIVDTETRNANSTIALAVDSKNDVLNSLSSAEKVDETNTLQVEVERPNAIAAFFPKDSLFCIFAHLLPGALLTCAQVNRHWNKVSSHDDLWQRHAALAWFAARKVSTMQNFWKKKYLEWLRGEVFGYYIPLQRLSYYERVYDQSGRPLELRMSERILPTCTSISVHFLSSERLQKDAKRRAKESGAECETNKNRRNSEPTVNEKFAALEREFLTGHKGASPFDNAHQERFMKILQSAIKTIAPAGERVHFQSEGFSYVFNALSIMWRGQRSKLRNLVVGFRAFGSSGASNVSIECIHMSSPKLVSSALKKLAESVFNERTIVVGIDPPSRHQLEAREALIRKIRAVTDPLNLIFICVSEDLFDNDATARADFYPISDSRNASLHRLAVTLFDVVMGTVPRTLLTIEELEVMLPPHILQRCRETFMLNAASPNRNNGIEMPVSEEKKEKSSCCVM